MPLRTSEGVSCANQKSPQSIAVHIAWRGAVSEPRDPGPETLPGDRRELPCL